MFGNGFGMWMRQPPQSETKIINPMNEVGIPTISAGIIFICVSIYVFMVFEMARAFNLWLPSLVLALGIAVTEAIVFYKWEFSQMILRQISGWLRKPVWVTVCGIFLVTFIVISITAFFILDWWIVNASIRQEAEACLGIGFVVGSSVLVFFLWNNTKDPWFPATKFWIMQPNAQQPQPERMMWPSTGQMKESTENE